MSIGTKFLAVMWIMTTATGMTNALGLSHEAQQAYAWLTLVLVAAMALEVVVQAGRRVLRWLNETPTDQGGE